MATDKTTRYVVLERSRLHSWQSSIKRPIVIWRTDDLAEAIDQLEENERFGLAGFLVDLETGMGADAYAADCELVEWERIAGWDGIKSALTEHPRACAHGC